MEKGIAMHRAGANGLDPLLLGPDPTPMRGATQFEPAGGARLAVRHGGGGDAPLTPG